MDWDVIFSYTRKEAIYDGVLIDCTTLAQDAGFKIPVALTNTLYTEYIKSALPGQDTNGRLWDVLFMLHLASKGNEKSQILFEVMFQMLEEKEEVVKLKAVVSPGDNAEPVLTIMLPNED